MTESTLSGGPAAESYYRVVLRFGTIFGIGVVCFSCAEETILRPEQAADDPTQMAQVAAGRDHSCGVSGIGSGAGPVLLVPAGPVFCWGRNDWGQLGDGAGGPGVYATKAVRVQTDVRFSRLAVGSGYTCGIGEDLRAFCWGQTTSGGSPTAIPAPVSGSLRFHLIDAGESHVCALAEGGALYCWGGNDQGQLGIDTFDNRTDPVRVPNLLVATFAVGGNHTCAITTNGTTYCWGANQHGQLGLDPTTAMQVATPTVVPSVPAFSLLTAGTRHTCALTTQIRTGGKPAYCWGSNEYGQLGRHSNNVITPTPTEVSDQFAFRALSAGADHTCGVVHNVEFTESQAPNNLGYCWGRNHRGQIGNGTENAQRLSPDSVLIPGELQSVSAGHEHTCALSGNAAFCWGGNDFGQLGDGTTTASSVPRRVSGTS